MGEISVRCDLRPGDVGAIVRWQGLTYAQEHGFNVQFEGYVAGALGEFAATRPSRARIWLAEDGAQVVGFVALVAAKGQADVASSDVAQLRWFLVDPSVRGQGLGTRLLGDALAFAREQGYRRVSLWTVAQLSAAARLYRSAGFEIVEAMPRHCWGVDVIEERYELTL